MLYVQALRTVWLVFVAILCIGSVETHVVLRDDHETEFGLSECGRKTLGVEEVEVSL